MRKKIKKSIADQWQTDSEKKKCKMASPSFLRTVTLYCKPIKYIRMDMQKDGW